MKAHRKASRSALAALPAVAALSALFPAALVHADVTVDEQTSMTLAGMKIDISTVERTSQDKQRRDSDTKCHGFLALFCRNMDSGEIVRLDKRLQWQLEPKKKLYTEHPFPTAEERAQAQQKLEQVTEQMKQCPMPQQAGAQPSGPDTSHCQLSAPQVDVKKTDEHAMVAGHDTQKTSIVLSQTCTEPQSGDVCEIDYGFDVWLTGDQIPGADERSAFERQYLAAQGLDPNSPRTQGLMQQFMAPYASTLKQLQGKSADLKGYPLRSVFSMSFGGPHCARAHQSQSQAQAQSPRPRGGGFLHGLASNAVSGGLGGLFHRNVNINTGSVGGQVAASAADQTATAATNEAANAAGTAAESAVSSNGAAGAAATTPSDKLTVVSFATETTSITTDAIPADVFDIPTGWQLQALQARQQAEQQQFTCPTHP